jgi:hypothetical protein
MEASLDAWYHDDSQTAIADVMGRQAMSRLPDGGGPIRAGVETLIADYDYFRGRTLTPDYLKHQPKELQYTPYTLESSKAIGKVSGPVLNLSPIQVEHMLNGSTGGAYRRLTDTIEATAEGRLGVEHIPFVRGVAMNRHQARSLDDFYTEWNKTKLKVKLDESRGKPNEETLASKDRLDDYADLMSKIRSLDKRDLKGRRSFAYEPYLVGLAREALRREPLEANPSPFTDKSVPDDVRDALVKFATNKAKTALLSAGMPVKAHKGDKDFAETMEKWESRQKADAAWLEEHKDSPHTQEAINGIRTSTSFRSLMAGKGRPEFQRGKETWSEHQDDLKRYNEKREQAKRLGQLPAKN